MKRKTTSVSLTIGSSFKEPNSNAVRQSSSTLIQPISVDPNRHVQSPSVRHDVASPGVAPVFTKCLQNISTTKGQLVVFECRIRATPPLQVHWYREHHPVIDSADFRILRKKACLSTVPEEVCTLVITEAYPEDSGVFKCIAENKDGAVSSCAQLFVYPEPDEIDVFETLQYMPALEAALEKMYLPNQAQNFTKERKAADEPAFNALQHTTKTDNRMTTYALENDDVETIEGFEAVSDCSPEPERSTDCDTELCGRDLTSRQIISSVREAAQESLRGYSSGVQPAIAPKGTSTSGATQNKQGALGVSAANLSSISTATPPSMFNYERPKYFIQAQPACTAPCSAQGTGTTNETHNFSDLKLSPGSSSISSPKYFSSPSFASTMESARQSAVPATYYATMPSRGQKASLPRNQAPAAYLSSVLPTHPDYINNNNTPVTVDSSYLEPMCRKMPKQAQPTSDHEIQGTKDALMQDLERKLRHKDNLLQNGNQRLTYEEKMARRLLGPENAASVFELQNADSTQDLEQHSENQAMPGQAAQDRNRLSSRGDNELRSIQEKLFPPRFLTIPGDLEIEEGRFCRIDFKVSGLPPPDVAWNLNGRPVCNDDFHKMIVSEKGFHSFILEVVQLSDAGEYECVASNRAGKAVFRMQLNVTAHERMRLPTFIQKPKSVRAMEGETVRIECQVAAVPFPQILLKKNNEMLQCNIDRTRLLQDSNGKISLLIYNVSKKDDGWYTISAVNEAGVATCHARIDVGTRMNMNISIPKPLKVIPTLSRYATFNGRGLDMKTETDFHENEPSYPGIYESEEL